MDEFSGLFEASTDNWNHAAVSLAKLLKEYPAGISKTILKMETQKNPKQNAVQYFDHLNILLDKPNKSQVKAAIFQSYIQNVRVDSDNITERLVIINHDNNSNKRPDTPAMFEMFLHSKFLRLGTLLALEKHICRFTGSVINVGTDNSGKNVTKILPTQNLIIVLSPQNVYADKLFLDNLGFTVSSFSSIDLENSENTNILVTVNEISEVTNDGSNDVVSITVIDSFSMPAVILLWNVEVSLSKLFHVGDSLAIMDPIVYTRSNGVEESLFLECGKSSIFLCIDGLSPNNLTCTPESGSPNKANRNPQGILDCNKVPTRRFIKDLSFDMINIVLLARVFSLKGNIQTAENPRQYTIGLKDKTGTCKVILSDGELGRETSKNIQVGQVLVFHNFVIYDKFYYQSLDENYIPETGEKILMSTDVSSVYNLSTCIGYLSSMSIRKNLTIKNAVDKRVENFFIQGYVTSLSERNDWENCEFLIHKLCKNQINEIKKSSCRNYYCHFCKVKLDAGGSINSFNSVIENGFTFWVNVTDDVGSNLCASVSNDVFYTFLGMHCDEFVKMGDEDKWNALKGCLGKEFEMSVSLQDIDFGQPLYRIDAAIKSQSVRYQLITSLKQFSLEQDPPIISPPQLAPVKEHLFKTPSSTINTAKGQAAGFLSSLETPNKHWSMKKDLPTTKQVSQKLSSLLVIDSPGNGVLKRKTISSPNIFQNKPTLEKRSCSATNLFSDLIVEGSCSLKGTSQFTKRTTNLTSTKNSTKHRASIKQLHSNNVFTKERRSLSTNSFQPSSRTLQFSSSTTKSTKNKPAIKKANSLNNVDTKK